MIHAILNRNTESCLVSCIRVLHALIRSGQRKHHRTAPIDHHIIEITILSERLRKAICTRDLIKARRLKRFKSEHRIIAPSRQRAAVI